MKRTGFRRAAVALAGVLAWGVADKALAQDDVSSPPETLDNGDATSTVTDADAEIETDTTKEEEVDASELAALEAALMADQGEGEGVATPQAGTHMPTINTALILDVAGAWFSQDSPAQTGSHDPNKTGFTLQQLEWEVNSTVDHLLRMDANIVFSLFGVEVEEAYVTTLAMPANLQLRAGQFLTRIGRLNATHPHTWSFVDQPILLGKFFGGENSRGLGVEASWLVPLPWFVEAVASVNNADGACCARSFFGGQDLGVDSPMDLLGTLALKQFHELGQDMSMMWGLSMQTGPNPSGQGNRTEIFAADLLLRYRPTSDPDRSSLNLQVEAMLRRRQVPDDLLQDWGLYAQAIYQLNPSWGAGLRYEEVSGTEADPLDPDWTSTRRRFSMQTTFSPSHFSRLRLQGAYDDAQFFERPGLSAMLALEVVVGEHGEHKY